MPNYTYPGVYVEELPATGPIAGVGTSTAAFIGPAVNGPILVPTKITNWKQFKDTFGEYISIPQRQYMAHAVEGFFKNGGTVCYIVRVGTAARAWFEIDDSTTGGLPGKTIRLEAKRDGLVGNGYQLSTIHSSLVNAATVLRAAATIASTNSTRTSIRVTAASDASKFKPGDEVTVDTAATTPTTERAVVARVRNDEVLLETPLSASYTSGTLRIANLVSTQRRFRLQGGTGLEAGSVIQLAQGGTTSSAKVIASLVGDVATLASDLGVAFTQLVGDANVGITSQEFTLAIKVGGVTRRYDNLSMDSRHSRYFTKAVDDPDVAVTLPTNGPMTTASPPDNLPVASTSLATFTNLANGANDNISGINSTHYGKGLDALVAIDDVNILCIPDSQSKTVQQAAITHCEQMGDRFAILDSMKGAGLFGSGSVQEQRSSVISAYGFAALYYPWLQIVDSYSPDDRILIPPSGHMAGIYARTDQKRGVHKAPANEMIDGALALEKMIGDVDQGQLNIDNVNVIRIFPNRGRPTVWGARTTAPSAEVPWRYVNVRRLFLFIEESIQVGIRWAVFEPNDLALWMKLRRTIGEFLTRVWRAGALFGATPDQAFYVKCDEELNPASVRALGQVFVEIGIAPVRPAEFVVIRIGMWEGGSEATEQ